MKIKQIQISNILSFKFFANIDDAPVIKFDEDLNILIGQNGSGKTTVLEVLNFIFKKVLFIPYSINEDNYLKKSEYASNIIQSTIFMSIDANTTSGFKLAANWDSGQDEQKIKIQVALDEVDKANLAQLNSKIKELGNIASIYTKDFNLNFLPLNDLFEFEINLRHSNQAFTYIAPGDPGFNYLVKYNFYKKLIELYNLDNPNDAILPLHESISVIGGYRNYSVFTPTVSLRDNSASAQIQTIRTNEIAKSTSDIEQIEPSIFNIVRLKIANIHSGLIVTEKNSAECEKLANEDILLKKINEKIKIVNLKVEIKLTNLIRWEYSFLFIDLKRNTPIANINFLSAGQKAIIHLVFESYGRGSMNGGVVIIDEPEIHLHYQFQNEYLKILEEINSDQNCQYIIVTHSEALVNSNTIQNVIRFGLDQYGHTNIYSPNIQSSQQTLIKIIDNTRSSYALFSKKVVLVEGDTDRYFFKAVFLELFPNLTQDISILEIGGKNNFQKWKEFFESFGLMVYFIGDFDNVFNLEFDDGTIVSKEDKSIIDNYLKQKKLDDLSISQKEILAQAHQNLASLSTFLTDPQLPAWKDVIDKFNSFSKISNAERSNETRLRHLHIDAIIESKYQDGVFILKKGAIEEYISTDHGKLSSVITFCNADLQNWLTVEDSKVLEIKDILSRIV